MSITITETAAKALRRIIDEQKTTQNIGGELALRLGIKAGGCSGMSEYLGLDVEPQPGDQILESQGIKIFIDPKSLLYLTGSQVDYREDPMNAGFEVKNPQAKSRCGCGHSFNV
jgi:iron-sulfur cluster assembly protein